MTFALAAALFLFPAPSAEATSAASVGSDFYYTFNQPGVLEEAGSMGNSTSPYFWLNSGGKLVIGDGAGATVQGTLSKNDPWRLLYGANNALDTDGGYRPQNLLRLVTRSEWGDAEQKVSFRIRANNHSDSPNRDGHNGILLFNRYQDGDNLYYAGVRQDGQAVIKKKIGGAYHTLASVQIFGVEGQYDRSDEPSLLPYNTWTTLKTQVYDRADGSVRIRLLIDRENDGSFVSILAADDDGVGGPPLRGGGHAGIRTDFMDVEFDNYRLTAL